MGYLLVAVESQDLADASGDCLDLLIDERNGSAVDLAAHYMRVGDIIRIPCRRVVLSGFGCLRWLRCQPTGSIELPHPPAQPWHRINRHGRCTDR